MSWNEALYRYQQKYGGQLLAGESDDALLILSWKDRPLAVDLAVVDAGRGATWSHARARISVTLGKPYKLTIGAEKRTSAGGNSVLRAVPPVAGYSADFGCPEVTRKRLIRCDNPPFTKVVLGSLELRNALLACPRDRVTVRPGPGGEGLHLITVSTDAPLYSLSGDGGGWNLDGDNEYVKRYGSEEEQAELARRAEQFFPRMDRFLDLARAVCGAVTQWPL